MHTCGHTQHAKPQIAHNRDRDIVQREHRNLRDALLVLFAVRLLQIVEALLEDVPLDAEHVLVAKVAPVEVGQITRIEGAIGLVEAVMRTKRILITYIAIEIKIQFTHLE